jgi:hypothetical protein
METGKTGEPEQRVRAGKYLKYAIGEILLVVIGILIALSINNWNENTQLKKEEKSSIKALLGEFESNKATIESCEFSISRMRKYGDSIRMELGPEKSNLEIRQVNNWLRVIGSTKRCEVSTDVLKDILNSGNLNIISNEEIRRKISKWSSVLKDLEREENEWALQFSSTITSYLNKWVQWDDIDYSNDSRNDSRYFKSRFSIDPRLVLQQVEFSNIMNNHYWRIERTEDRTKSLLLQTNEVIKLMKTELNLNE